MSAAARARGLGYEAPYEGGRLRPDGEQLRWRNARAQSQDLPFLCGDLTPRTKLTTINSVRQRLPELKKIGAIGEILGTFLDAAGNPVFSGKSESAGLTTLSFWNEKPKPDWTLRVRMQSAKSLVRYTFAFRDLPLP